MRPCSRVHLVQLVVCMGLQVLFRGVLASSGTVCLSCGGAPDLVSAWRRQPSLALNLQPSLRQPLGQLMGSEGQFPLCCWTQEAGPAPQGLGPASNWRRMNCLRAASLVLQIEMASWCGTCLQNQAALHRRSGQHRQQVGLR